MWLLIVDISLNTTSLHRCFLIIQGKKRMGLRQAIWKIQRELCKWVTEGRYRPWEEYEILIFIFKPPKTAIVGQRVFQGKQGRIVTHQFTYSLPQELNCIKHLNHLWLCLACFQPQGWHFLFFLLCDRHASPLFHWGSEILTSLSMHTRISAIQCEYYSSFPRLQCLLKKDEL